MCRMFNGLGNAFEILGYHVERAGNRRREDGVTKRVRRMRMWILILAIVLGVILPAYYAIGFRDLRLLPAFPLAAGTIAMAVVAMRARTPAGAYGRMMLALLLLALTMTILILASEAWWPIP